MLLFYFLLVERCFKGFVFLQSKSDILHYLFVGVCWSWQKNRLMKTFVFFLLGSGNSGFFGFFVSAVCSLALLSLLKNVYLICK